ncbi:hypothetical protein HRM2_02570 [Desulforapulum autotrophicum HRM2]|uniref:HD domain-containing protein n=1 Tax=Desulforapulum autotrophicum (strain ATCC 43914 / DSM 3382 / VKM B-1955 / HRM2) TaxID=177437 RepID=C0QFI3_DESAH|nr:hypothetical protein [Desulforapulum autotrophicum]ACN13379.1 hypothetical protein HRM2_02570 [Desulforapulum autotrophicum HRM2]
MKATYTDLRNMARKIVAALPRPAFCTLFQGEIARSKDLLHTHPLLTGLKTRIIPLLDDDFGHGMLHSELVAIDAGAIVQIEMGLSPGAPEMMRAMVLVQVAGLLHDIKRKEKKHAQKGALFAENLLTTEGFDLTALEIKIVCNAIGNHEAFQEKNIGLGKPVKSRNHRSDSGPESTTGLIPQLISDALYDADKFRWGPDNFTHTVWDMVVFAKIPLADFLKHFPGGMKKLAQIRNTFRTDTGKAYGPGFIDVGLETGKRLAARLRSDYSELFS